MPFMCIENTEIVSAWLLILVHKIVSLCIMESCKVADCYKYSYFFGELIFKWILCS